MSTKPGVTSAPSASISCRPLPATRPTAVIIPSVMATSAVRASTPVPSTTVPPRMTRSSISQPLDDRHVGLSATFAHRLQAVAPAGALELVEQGRHQTHAGGTERVAERDGAPVHIDLGKVGPGLPLPCEHDGGERLVDLDEVDVVERHARLRQRVRG